jgi:hypothetical protein
MTLNGDTACGLCSYSDLYNLVHIDRLVRGLVYSRFRPKFDT